MKNSLTLMNNDQALPSSSNTKTLTVQDSPDEESSWTFYMQDFVCDGDKDVSSFASGYGTSNSLVSDAASSAAIKLASNNNNNETVLFVSEGSNDNKLSFKRPRKAKGAGVNDDLEDTASSPVNSPKISYMNQLTLKQNESKNKNVSGFNNQGHTNSSSHNHNGLDILEGDIDTSELKKKGLSLVPVSMLAKYFG